MALNIPGMSGRNPDPFGGQKKKKNGTVNSPYGSIPTTGSGTPSDDAYSAYSDAATGQDKDYSDIMGKFKGLFDNAGTGLPDFNFTAAAPEYQQSPEYAAALGRLTNLSETGGFSAEDLSNIRERAISPIRAVYANAQRNVARQSRLQGGYSPNAMAATAKMAREQSSLASDASTKANADIAEKVASNKISTAGPLAQLTAAEQAQHNDFNLKTADFNRMMDQMRLGKEEYDYEMPNKLRTEALSGMAGLYGTTPAREATRGAQALNTAQLEEQVKTNKFNRKKSVWDQFRG